MQSSQCANSPNSSEIPETKKSSPTPKLFGGWLETQRASQAAEQQRISNIPKPERAREIESIWGEISQILDLNGAIVSADVTEKKERLGILFKRLQDFEILDFKERVELHRQAYDFSDVETPHLEVARAGGASEIPIVKVNGVGVTKHGSSKPAFEKMLENLRIDPDQLKGRGLSLGEGMSGLVLFLSQRGFKIRGVDLWYGNDDLQSFAEKNQSVFDDLAVAEAKKAKGVEYFATPLEMWDYVRNNRSLLVTGDARRLRFPDASVDYIICYKLLNNLLKEDPLYVIDESLRVLSVGGTFYAFDYVPHGKYGEEFRKFMLAFFQSFYGDTIEVKADNVRLSIRRLK